jgi:hypothetical protein
VKIAPDPNLSPSRAKIRVMTKDGRVLEKFMETLDLSKDRERMKKDLVRKFQDLSTPILGEEKTKKLISRVKRLDKIAKLKALSNLIKG